MTEYEKMHSGMIYDCLDEELGAVQKQSHRLCDEYNALGTGDDAKKQAVLRELFPHDDFGLYRTMERPIFIDNMREITIGKNFYSNIHFTISNKLYHKKDCCHLFFGDPQPFSLWRFFTAPFVMICSIVMAHNYSFIPMRYFCPLRIYVNDPRFRKNIDAAGGRGHRRIRAPCHMLNDQMTGYDISVYVIMQRMYKRCFLSV